MMMSLGMFVFSLPTAAYQTLQHKCAWRHADLPRIGARPASQYLGPDAETMSFSGVILPELAGSMSALKDLREMGDQGEAWALVSGIGEVLGSWVITDLDTTSSIFFEDGVERRADFTLQLRRVDDPPNAGAAT